MPEKLDKKIAKRIENLTRIDDEVIFGRVEIDADKCIGCGLCAEACAADSIIVEGLKARMREGLEAQCMTCCDCMAICPQDAVRPVRFIEFKYHFKYLDRGESLPPRTF